jgi:GT2 family glycosyltransferase
MNPLYTVSIVTPWYEHAELIPAYEQAVQGADEVIIVDNGSSQFVANHLEEMCKRLSTGERTAQYIRFFDNKGFGMAANEGLKRANGNLLVCLNNDVKAEGDWVGQLKSEMMKSHKTIYGKNLKSHFVEGAELPYIDGWCIAAWVEVWKTLDFYDTDTYQFAYYEDADLCFRAVTEHNYRLQDIPDLLLTHLDGGNTTSKGIASLAYAHSDANRQKFVDKVLRAMEAAK